MSEDEYFGPGAWTLDHATFEWVHVRTGLSAYDLYQFIHHYEAGILR